jgi:hypothetical protein
MTTDPENPPTDLTDLPTEDTAGPDEPETELSPERTVETPAQSAVETPVPYAWGDTGSQRSAGCLKGFAACGCLVLLVGILGVGWAINASLSLGPESQGFWRAFSALSGDTAEPSEADGFEEEGLEEETLEEETLEEGEGEADAVNDHRWRKTHPRRKLPKPDEEAETVPDEASEMEPPTE